MATLLKEKESIVEELKTESNVLKNKIRNLSNEVKQLKVSYFLTVIVTLHVTWVLAITGLEFSTFSSYCEYCDSLGLTSSGIGW